MILAQATRADIAHVTANLRASDIEETRFMRGPFDAAEVHDSLVSLWQDEPFWAFKRYDGEPVALLGITGMGLPGLGSIWLVGTPAFDRNPIAGIRAAKRFLSRHARDWVLIGNQVPAHMTARLRWLEHLGFDILRGEANHPRQGVLQFWMRPTAAP